MAFFISVSTLAPEFAPEKKNFDVWPTFKIVLLLLALASACMHASIYLSFAFLYLSPRGEWLLKVELSSFVDAKRK